MKELVLNAIKELYHLQGDIMTEGEEEYYKQEIASYSNNKNVIKLRKLNSRIKKMGGKEIARINK